MSIKYAAAAIFTLAVMALGAWLFLNHGIFLHMDQQDKRNATRWEAQR